MIMGQRTELLITRPTNNVLDLVIADLIESLKTCSHKYFDKRCAISARWVGRPSDKQLMCKTSGHKIGLVLSGGVIVESTSLFSHDANAYCIYDMADFCIYYA